MVLDFLRRNFFSAAVDLIFVAPHHDQVARGRTFHDIARTVKTVGIKGTHIMGRAVKVAAEGVRATSKQCSRNPVRHFITLFINNFDFIIFANWTTLGIEHMPAVIIKPGVIHQALSHAKYLLQLAA